MNSFTSLELIKTLKSVLDIEQHLSGIQYLKGLVKNIAQTFGAKFVFVGHPVNPEHDSIQTDVVWAGNDYFNNFTYGLKGTPCENVLSGNRVCIYAKDITDKFPEDKLLIEMGVDSYIGSPMFTREGELLGILVFLDDKPVMDVDFYSAVVEFLSARVAAELEKYHIEEELKRQVDEKTSKLEKINQELRIALNEIKTLQGIIPICANCKKIRDDEGYWNRIESYIEQHSDAKFSHGICRECAEKLYGDYIGAIKKE